MRRYVGLFGVALSVAGAAAASTGATGLALVGRWQTVRTCQGLVAALKKTGLSPLAPGVVGDYFPNQTSAELAKKKNLCSGAKPQLHSHFFTADRKFGSLDQHATRSMTVAIGCSPRPRSRSTTARSGSASRERR